MFIDCSNSRKVSLMTRRTATRQAVMLMFGMTLGKMDVLDASGGQLTCDLGQWSHIVFKHKGRVISVPVAEVFAVLAEGRT